MESTDFLDFDTDSQKLKVDQNFFRWSWSEMDVVSLVMGLKNVTVSQKWTGGIN